MMFRDRRDAGRQLAARATGCRVTVAARNRHQRRGRLYSIRIDLRTPGEELVAGHGHPQDHAHEDIHVAIRDAFAAARRRLEEHVRRRRGDVKAHAGATRGKEPPAD